MARFTRKKSAIEREYQKQRNRITNFIRRAEKRGYSFKENALPDRPKKITQASVRRLKNITPESLYKKSTALSNDGKIISGTERKKQERKKSAKKAALTRKRNRTKENINYTIPSEPNNNVDDLGRHILSKIYSMIEDVSKAGHRWAAESLKNMLSYQINQYGKDAVIKSLANTPEESIELAEIALRYNPGDNRHDNAIRELQLIITGEIPSLDELKEAQDYIDVDDYDDFY